MAADVTFGHLGSFLRGPSLGGPRALPLRRSSSTRSGSTAGRWPRRGHHSASSRFVDPLAYASEDIPAHSASYEPHDTEEAVQDSTILEFSADSPDDHWALAPEAVDEMTLDDSSDVS